MKIIFLKEYPKKNDFTYTNFVPFKVIFFNNEEYLKKNKEKLIKIIKSGIHVCEEYPYKYKGAIIYPDGEIIACLLDPNKVLKRIL
jgi:hypothetical protein